MGPDNCWHRGGVGVECPGEVRAKAVARPSGRVAADAGARRAGGARTQRPLGGLHAVSRNIGATFVVVFLPFKSQVYLPWLAGSQPAPELSRELQFYLPDNPGTPDVAEMLRNRLAQNRMMRRFCEARGIAFVDTTDALTARFLSGENVYFPDESHLNERGQALVADTLTSYLRLGGFLPFR